MTPIQSPLATKQEPDEKNAKINLTLRRPSSVPPSFIMLLRLLTPPPVTNNMKLISSNYVHVSPNAESQITVIMKADGTDSRNVS